MPIPGWDWGEGGQRWLEKNLLSFSPLKPSVPPGGHANEQEMPKAGQTGSQLADIYRAITRTSPKMGAN